MSVVGRAYVTVRAVTRQVEGDVQKGVDKALGNVEKKMDKAGQDSGKEFGGGVGKGVKKSGVDKAIDSSVRKYDADRGGRDIGTVLGQAIGESLLERGPIERAFRKVGASMSISADREGSVIGKKLSKGVVKGLKLGANPMVWLGALAPPAIADALQVVSSAAASATALASTLGPALGAAGVVGASSMASLVGAIGTVTLALKVQSDALDEFKTGLRPIRDEWIDIGKAVQGQVLPALDSAANSLMSNLGPTLRTGLVETGRAIGDVAARFEKLGENEQFQRRLGVVLRSNAEALRDFGATGALAVSSFTTLAAAASPLTQRFSQWTRELGLNVTQQLAAAEMSGRLGDWFDRAGDITAQWGRVLGNVGSALVDVFSAGLGEGRHLLDMLESVTDRFENWTGSLEGQNALRDWFEEATPVMSALGDVLGGLVEGLGEWMSGVGTTEDTLQSLADMLPNLGSALGVLSTGFRELATAILPAVGSLAERLTPAVADVASTLGDNLGRALDDLIPALGDMLDAALRIASSFAPAIPILGDIASIAAGVLAPALAGIAATLDALPDPIMGVVGAAVALKFALGGLAGSAKLGPLVTNVGESLGAVRKQMAATSGAAGKMRAGLSGATGMLGGPWGLAIAGATVVIGKFVGMHQAAKDRVDNLTASLDAQTGAITDNTRATIAKALEDSGALGIARDLGINLDLVTEAALGNKDAIAQVASQLGAYNDDIGPALETGKHFDIALGNQAQSAYQLADAIGDQRGALDEAKESTDRVADATRHHGNALKGVAPTVDRMAKVEAQLGGAARRASGDLKDQKKATDDLRRSTLTYHEAVLKIIQGNISFEQAIDDATKEILKGKRTLDINTQAGRDNMTALLGVASAAGEVTGSAEKQQRALDRARDFIERWADKAGYGTDQAGKFADKLITLKNKAEDIPKNVDTRVSVDTGAALVKLQNFSAALDGLDGRVAKYHLDLTAQHMENRLDRAGGGWISGPGTTTSDSIAYGNANVSNREFVVNAEDAARNARLLEALNSGKDVTRAVQVQGGRGPVSITVNNPVPERAGKSVSSVLGQRAFEAGWAI